MRKNWLIVAALLLVFIPTVSAFTSCSNVTITATEPQNLTYPYSINLPLTWAAVNASKCWVILDSEKYYDNKTLDCSETSTRIDVDYDGNYTAWFWAANSSSGECNVSLPFRIDRTSEFEEGKPLAMVFIITLMIVFGFVIMVFSRVLKEKYQLLLNSLSFIFVYIAFALILLVAREYVKIPSVYDLLNTLFWATMIILTLLIFIISFFFVLDFVQKRMDKLKRQRLGEE